MLVSFPSMFQCCSVQPAAARHSAMPCTKSNHVRFAFDPTCLSQLLIISSVYAIMATNVFKTRAPEYFGTFHRSLFTMFQVLTGTPRSFPVASLFPRCLTLSPLPRSFPVASPLLYTLSLLPSNSSSRLLPLPLPLPLCLPLPLPPTLPHCCPLLLPMHLTHPSNVISQTKSSPRQNACPSVGAYG